MDISREDAQKKTYIDQLMDDTGCRIEQLAIAMEDRESGGSVSWNTEQTRPDDDDDASFFFIIPIKKPFFILQSCLIVSDGYM